MSKKSSKRQRTGGLPPFGAQLETDMHSTPQNNPSSSASSTRNISLTTPPSLTTLCARVFVANFVKLRNNESVWSHISAQLEVLPDGLIPKIFAMLQSACPNYLVHEAIVTYFLRGPSVSLRKELPGVKQRTILDIARINPNVRELELTGFNNISDAVFASLLRRLSHLRTLILRGCTNVGAETMRALSEECSDLRLLNLNYTSITPASLAPVVSMCSQIEVLKLAGIQNWTDATCANFFAGLPQGCRLPALHTLKLRQTSMSDAALTHMVKLCPALSRIDLSFTLVRHPLQIFTGAATPLLQKLSLTSTAVPTTDLIAVLTLLPDLRILAIGALGPNRGPRASIDNTSAMTMTDKALRSLTEVLEQCHQIEDISLVGNTKLGLTSKVDKALSEFITRVGRTCKKLNLAGIHSLHSTDLIGLLPLDADGPSVIEILNLNNTAIDDDAGHYIASCLSLKTLSVAGTKMTSNGLFPVIECCEELVNLDLTSCRGIKVVDRRRFFQVWDENRLKSSNT